MTALAPFHYLVKAWYDGQSYNGSQFQPGLRTVDGALVEGLHDLGYLPRDGPHNDFFKVAGRTDRGVSALGAVYYVNVLKTLHPCEVNEWLKIRGHDIMIWAVAPLPGAINPRQAMHRVYKYFHVMAGDAIKIDNVRKGLAMLAGDHEFKGFTKARINPAIRTTRALDAAEIDVTGDVIVFTFRSQGFLWEQVRRMVA
nr:hypothetical protein [Candidatus Sigynarchaeota archaeon]